MYLPKGFCQELRQWTSRTSKRESYLKNPTVWLRVHGVLIKLPYATAFCSVQFANTQGYLQECGIHVRELKPGPRSVHKPRGNTRSDMSVSTLTFAHHT